MSDRRRIFLVSSAIAVGGAIGAAIVRRSARGSGPGGDAARPSAAPWLPAVPALLAGGSSAAREPGAREPVADPAGPPGRFVGNVASYDLGSRLLFGPLFRSIASDVAAVAPPAAEVLEVGCGPGHLAVRMARDHGLRVTASDLDPAMVARARGSVERAFAGGDARRPVCVEADVSALPFPDASFDVVVSTFSMHHWADPDAGFAEIHRVLRPGGHALV